MLERRSLLPVVDGRFSQFGSFLVASWRAPALLHPLMHGNLGKRNVAAAVMTNRHRWSPWAHWAIVSTSRRTNSFRYHICSCMAPANLSFESVLPGKSGLSAIWILGWLSLIHAYLVAAWLLLLLMLFALEAFALFFRFHRRRIRDTLSWTIQKQWGVFSSVFSFISPSYVI